MNHPVHTLRERVRVREKAGRTVNRLNGFNGPEKDSIRNMHSIH
jgi:hypothetical protein